MNHRRISSLLPIGFSPKSTVIATCWITNGRVASWRACLYEWSRCRHCKVPGSNVRWPMDGTHVGVFVQDPLSIHWPCNCPLRLRITTPVGYWWVANVMDCWLCAMSDMCDCIHVHFECEFWSLILMVLTTGSWLLSLSRGCVVDCCGWLFLLPDTYRWLFATGRRNDWFANCDLIMRRGLSNGAGAIALNVANLRCCEWQLNGKSMVIARQVYGLASFSWLASCCWANCWSRTAMLQLMADQRVASSLGQYLWLLSAYSHLGAGTACCDVWYSLCSWTPWCIC